jgi:mRNA interferase MazF
MKMPLRGEVWLCDLGLAAKIRPVVIVSVPFGDQDYALFHVVPHTTSVRHSQFEAAVAAPFLQPGVFNIRGSQSVPRGWLVRLLGALTIADIGEVEASLRRWLRL